MIENPFTYTVMLRLAGQPQMESFGWEIPREQWESRRRREQEAHASDTHASDRQGANVSDRQGANVSDPKEDHTPDWVEIHIPPESIMLLI